MTTCNPSPGRSPNVQRIPAVLIALLFIYELVAIYNGRRGDTLSEMVWQIADHNPLLPFLLGLLMGHFFWPRGD